MYHFVQNFQDKNIPVKSGYNIEAFRYMLRGYPKEKLLTDGIAYGWPLNWKGYPLPHSITVPNHPSVERDFPLATQLYQTC